jgi:hypothetical protein
MLKDLLAQSRMLHTLRMLNLPTIDYDMIENPTSSNFIAPDIHGVRLCRITMQVFANEIFKYMLARASSLVLFAVQPSVVGSTKSRPQTDTNGHQWPEYFFIKGHISNAQGRNEVVAVPLRGAKLEMPESTVLFHSV